MSIRTCLALAAALGAVAATAHRASADATKDLDDVYGKVASTLSSNDFSTGWTAEVDDFAKFIKPEACYDAVKAAKAAGLADGTKVYSQHTYDKKDDKGTYFTVADAAALCKQYEDRYVHEYVETALTFTYLEKPTMDHAVEGQYESEAKSVGILGQLCADRVDAALAFGIPATEKVESPRYNVPAIALGDIKAQICQPAIDFATKRTGDIKDLAQAKHDAIVAVYTKAGIKGKRLELFVSYGMPADTGFLAAGCTKWVDNIKSLKAAKKLFVWLEGDSGYTVRKFTIKGDSYSVSEKTFSTQEGAYAGCK